MKVLSILCLLMCSAVTLASEHPLSTLTGTDIDLRVYDHALAGSIEDFVFFGQKLEGKFESEMTIRKRGHVARATFKQTGRGIGGVVTAQSPERETKTDVILGAIDGTAQTITVSINGVDSVVTITADGFENDHFINPTYSFTLAEKSYEMTLQGQACYGFSAHILMMILGAIAY